MSAHTLHRLRKASLGKFPPNYLFIVSGTAVEYKKSISKFKVLPKFQEMSEHHHELPQGRVVHGHDMTFHAPVYGEIISDGGRVYFEDSIGWGTVVNPAGHIHAKHRAFSATLQAQGGIVEVTTAESCLIIGHTVTVQNAIKCQIFAHKLRIGTAAGCMIAGRDVEISHSSPYKLEPNMITMVVPEAPNLEEVLRQRNADVCEMKLQIDDLDAGISTYRKNPLLAQFLSIRSKVRAGITVLTEEQSIGYFQMEERFADDVKALEQAVSERRVIAHAMSELAAQIQSMREEHAARLGDCHCKIANVNGETIVRQLLEVHDDPDLSLISLPMIPKILFRNDATLKFLYAAHEGTISWCVVSKID